MYENTLLPIRLGIDVGSTTVKVAVLDDDDKLIVVDKGKNIDDKTIEKITDFQEKYYKHIIIRSR